MPDSPAVFCAAGCTADVGATGSSIGIKEADIAVVGRATMDGESGACNAGGVAMARVEIGAAAIGPAVIGAATIGAAASAVGFGTEAVAGAAMPRLRSSSFSSSISAFMAASSLATAGGILGSCKPESARIVAVVAAPAGLAASGEAGDESISCFADIPFAAIWFEAVVSVGVCATDFAPTNRQKMNTARRIVVFDNGILMIAVFMLVVFMLDTEQSFPQWNDTRRNLRNFAHASPSPLGRESINSITRDVKIV